MVKLIALGFMALGWTFLANAQHGCFVRTDLDARSVYPQQPFKVTITVLTPTWYTQPLEFQNLEIPNAFIIPFEQTRPGMFDVNGKQYAGLSFYYIVIPYQSGQFTIPRLEIVATTPPEGASTPREITLHTVPQKFVVKPIPRDYPGDWLVSKDVRIEEHWNRPLRQLKVGDVIERTITEEVKGTLPQFIPDLDFASPDWAGIYPHAATLRDARDEYDANGVRTQKFSYLLEKEGEYELPPVTVTWWNPYSRRVFKRSTTAIKIKVAANANLGILATLKDSLNAVKPANQPRKEARSPLMVFGIAWYWFALYSALAVAAMAALLKACAGLYERLNNRYVQYKESEGYWFRRFVQAPPSFPALLNAMYAWWDRFGADAKCPSMIADSKARGNEMVAAAIAGLYEEVLSNGDDGTKASGDVRNRVGAFRKALRASKPGNGNTPPHQQPWS